MCSACDEMLTEGVPEKDWLVTNKETLLLFGSTLGFDADKLRAARFTTPELVQLLLARARKLRDFYKSEFLPDNLEKGT